MNDHDEVGYFYTHALIIWIEAVCSNESITSVTSQLLNKNEYFLTAIIVNAIHQINTFEFWLTLFPSTYVKIQIPTLVYLASTCHWPSLAWRQYIKVLADYTCQLKHQVVEEANCSIIIFFILFDCLSRSSFYLNVNPLFMTFNFIFIFRNGLSSLKYALLLVYQSQKWLYS